MSKERPWAYCSGHSWQMSHHERFAQVAHDKWANERFAKNVLTKTIFFGTLFVRKKKTRAHSLFLKRDVSESLRSLRSLTKKWATMEQFTQVIHQKWATMSEMLRSFTKNEQMSESLRSLTKNEQLWVIRSGHSPKMSDWERIAQVAHDKRATWVNHSFFLSEWLFPSQKTSDSLKNIWINHIFVSFFKFKKKAICSLPLF